MKSIQIIELMAKDIENMEKFLQLPIHAIKMTVNNYSLSRIKKDENIFHQCTIIEIPYDDVLHCAEETPEIKDIYDRYVQLYGQEKVDLLFPKDVEVIRGKLMKVIDFVFDRLMEEDIDQLDITFYNFPDDSYYSSIPQLIYSMCQENYTFSGQYVIGALFSITIKRRSD